MLAILYGVLIGTLTSNEPGRVLLIGSATAVLLALPAAFMKELAAPSPKPKKTQPKTSISAPFAVFLLAIASSLAVSAMANDYFYQLSSRIPGLAFGEVASLSQTLFAITAVAFLASSLGFGFLAREWRLTSRVFVWSLVVSAAGLLVLALIQTRPALSVGALLIGLGTGLNTAAQFPVLRKILGTNQVLGDQVGVFNLVGVLPSILVPALGAVLLTLSKENWPFFLGFTVAGLALTSSLLVARKVLKNPNT